MPLCVAYWSPSAVLPAAVVPFAVETPAACPPLDVCTVPVVPYAFDEWLVHAVFPFFETTEFP